MSSDSKTQTCPECDGRGVIYPFLEARGISWVEESCKYCEGTGKVETVEVSVS